MTNQPHNLPAFPSDVSYVGEYGEKMSRKEIGMYLRDWFAGQALIGMISSAGHPVTTSFGGAEHAIANAAYLMADAMLKERAKYE